MEHGPWHIDSEGDWVRTGRDGKYIVCVYEGSGDGRPGEYSWFKQGGGSGEYYRTVDGAKFAADLYLASAPAASPPPPPATYTVRQAAQELIDAHVALMDAQARYDKATGRMLDALD